MEGIRKLGTVTLEINCLFVVDNVNCTLGNQTTTTVEARIKQLLGLIAKLPTA